MHNAKALVSLAIGSRQQSWKRYCEPNWQAYGRKYRFDVLCLDRPLDNSERASKRSPAWQKCLILSQPFAQKYQRIVWLDSDILINNRIAADITEAVPVEKIGAVEDISFAQSQQQTTRLLLDRFFDYWSNSVVNCTPNEYYAAWGLPAGCDRVVDTAVLVLSPAHHREILENVYHRYEEKPGPEWHMEMRPLSYELVRSGRVHCLDARFNLMWTLQQFLYYPFLTKEHPRRSLASTWMSNISRWLGLFSMRTLRGACINAAFQTSFFFHFGGINSDDVDFVRETMASWSDYWF